MAKKFKKILMAKSNEVSLCSKYNSGANKQTEFEIIKDKNHESKDIKPVIETLVKLSEIYTSNVAYAEVDEYDAFRDFLNYWLEYDVNNAYYNVLSEALQNALCEIKYKEMTKEEKVQEYQKLFDMFIEEYKNLPITKTQDGKYEVSLVSNSHIQDIDTNPQNETDTITKEKTSKMKKEEQMNLVEKAFELIKSAFSLEKTETPAEEQPEVQQEVAEETQIEEVKAETEAVEEIAENAEEPAKEAEVEAPVVEEVVAKAEEVEQAEEQEVATEEAVEEVAEQVVEETAEETVEEVVETEQVQETEVEALAKAKLEVEKELAELKKSNEEKQLQIEKMEYVQKAKDEFSMLVGTPEEIGSKLYSISKSSLDEETKSFIFDQFKKTSVQNSAMVEELGSISKNAGDLTDEEAIYAKAEEIAKTKGISIKQALRQI